jgi:hypothetical protein
MFVEVLSVWDYSCLKNFVSVQFLRHLTTAFRLQDTVFFPYCIYWSELICTAVLSFKTFFTLGRLGISGKRNAVIRHFRCMGLTELRKIFIFIRCLMKSAPDKFGLFVIRFSVLSKFG